MSSYKKKSLLWEISAEDLPGPSWLFGTMHVSDERVFNLMPIIEPILEKVDAVALEYDIGIAFSDEEMARVLLAPQPLDQVLGEKKFSKLEKIIAKSFGVEISPMVDIQPFLIAQRISQSILAKDREAELDLHLWQRAQALGKEVIGLEDPAEHLAVLERIPYETQVKMLLEIGRRPFKMRRHVRHMLDLYEKGEIYRLHRVLRRHALGMRHVLVFDRNIRMADRIASLCKEKTLLAAVGVGHLAGGKGIIRLLKKRGLKLKPVPMPPLHG